MKINFANCETYKKGNFFFHIVHNHFPKQYLDSFYWEQYFSREVDLQRERERVSSLIFV